MTSSLDPEIEDSGAFHTKYMMLMIMGGIATRHETETASAFYLESKRATSASLFI